MGLVFERSDSLFMVYDHWPHTFQLAFPDLHVNSEVFQDVNCTSGSDFIYECHSLSNAIMTLRTIKDHYITSQQHVLSRAKQIMPSGDQLLPKSRSRRSILPFIGDISHALFGTATSKEVNRLRDHVINLEKRQGEVADQFSKYSEDLSSFMQISNKRLSTMTLGIKDNHNALIKTAKMFTTVAHTTEDNLRFSIHLAKDIYLAMSLEESLQEFLQGIQAFINHRISPFLIPFDDLVSTITNINEELVKTRSNLQVKTLTANEMYSSPKFQWTYKNSSIFITYYFPLVSQVSKFTVYKIHSFPFPINSSSSHVTSLPDVPKYLAFSKDQHYYVYLDKLTQSDTYIDSSKANLPLYPISQTSCITAIFFDNKQVVKEFCDYRVQLNGLTAGMQYICAGKYIVFKTKEIFLNCPTGRQRVEGCNICIFDVPCLCDVSTVEAYFPPRLNDCYNSQTPTVIHPVNLAVLMNFHDLDKLNEIESSSTYSRVPNLATPDIKLFAHNFSKMIADDKQNDLSLLRLSQRVRNGQHVFKSLSEPILDSLLVDDDETSILSWNSILTFVDTGVIFLLGVSLLYVSYKVHRLQALCVGLQNVHQVRCAQTFNLFSTEQPVVQPPTEIITVIDNRILYVLLTLTILTLIFIAFKYLSRKFRQATIALEITDGHNCVIIPLMLIPFCPKFYHVQSDKNFHSFMVRGCLRPVFYWNPGTLNITHLQDNSRLIVPHKIKISMI